MPRSGLGRTRFPYSSHRRIRRLNLRVMLRWYEWSSHRRAPRSAQFVRMGEKGAQGFRGQVDIHPMRGPGGVIWSWRWTSMTPGERRIILIGLGITVLNVAVVVLLLVAAAVNGG